MKKIVIVILSIAMVMCCGCSSNNTSEDNLTVTCAQLDSVGSMDVAKTTDNYLVAMNVFDRLFETELMDDGTTRIIESLCENYSVADDGLTYSFKLKDGVVFSNGNPLTSDDVKYTFERLLSIGIVNDDIPWEVKGAEEFVDNKAQDLEGFRITDDLNFEIELSEANAGFIAELSSCAVSIVDKQTTEKAENFGIDCEETIGTGPYKVTENVKDDHLTLEYNDKYWGQEPDVKRFIFYTVPEASVIDMSFKNNEIDIMCLNYLDPKIVQEEYGTGYDDKRFESYQLGMNYLALNANNKYLSDVNVRKAINMAIDVDSIVTNILYDNAISQQGIIPAGVTGHNKDLITRKYDPEAAVKILEEAGYEPGEITFEIAMTNDANEADKLQTQLIVDNLKDVGITATIKMYEENIWMEKRIAGEMDAYTAYWLMDYNDPSNIMYTFFGSPELTASRSINYKNEEIMDRVSNARFIVDEEERTAEYRELEKIIAGDDAAWVPLYANNVAYCVSDKIKSMKPHWSGYVCHFNVKDVVLN